MEKEYIICEKCFKSLDHMGLAQEIYSIIASHYVDYQCSMQLSGKWDNVIKFLERKGYVITHEIKNKLYAKPYMIESADCIIMCRIGHKKNKGSDISEPL